MAEAKLEHTSVIPKAMSLPKHYIATRPWDKLDGKMSVIASKTVHSLPDWLLDPKCPQKRLRLNGRKVNQNLKLSQNTKAPFCQTFSPPPSLGKGVQQNFNSLIIAPLPELEGFFFFFFCYWSPSNTLNWCFYKIVILGLFGLVFYIALVFYYFSLFPGFRLIKGSVNHTSFAQNTFHEVWKQFSFCLPKIFRKEKKNPLGLKKINFSVPKKPIKCTSHIWDLLWFSCENKWQPG